MRKEIDTYELIEQFLTGRLNEAAKLEVEQRIASDRDFAALVNEQEQISRLIEDGVYLDIKSKINDIHKSNPINGKLHKRINGKGLLGLLILLVLTVGVTVYVKQNKTQPEYNAISDTAILPSYSPGLLISTPDSSRTHIRDTKKQIPDNTEAEKSDIITEPKEQIISEEKLPEKIIVREPPKDNLPKEKIGVEIVDSDASETVIQPDESPNTLEEKETDCSTVTIDAKVNTTMSCEEKPSGKIHVLPGSIAGGTPPYEVSIDNEANYYSSYLFDNLNASIYSVSIRDRDNCTSYLGVFRVDSEPCSHEYVFAPDKGETWTVPNKNKEGILRMYDKSGQLVYELMMEFGGTYKWHGITSAGDLLPMGLYQFILELTDSETVLGHVTIVR